MTGKKGLSGFLDRMENSTVQALERQVDHLTKETKRMETAYRKGLSGHPEGCICIDHETIRNLKAEVERLRKEIQKGIDAGYINADWEIAAASPAAPDTSGEASPTRVASPPLPLPKADDCIHEVCAGTWLRTADMATLPCPCECHAPSGASPTLPDLDVLERQIEDDRRLGRTTYFREALLAAYRKDAAARKERELHAD